MIKHTYDLDMVPGGVPLVVHVSQYDEDVQLMFNLFAREGTFTVPTGTTAAIRGTKRDGNGISVDVSISGNIVTVDLDQQMTAIAGPNKYEITLYSSSGKELNTANFILDVERAALDKDTLGSTSEIRELVNIIDRTDEIIAAGRQADKAARDMQDIADQVEADKNAAVSAKNSAVAAQNATQDLKDQVDQKAAQIREMVVVSDQIATQALDKATNVENETAEMSTTIEQLRGLVDNVRLTLESKVDDGYADTDGYLILTANGEAVGDPIGPFAGGGGGGGGGGNNAILTVHNTTGWLSKTISHGATCPISLLWTSIEDEMPTGDGTLKITVNGVIRTTLQVAQGNVSVDLGPFMAVGSNIVKAQVSDIYGNARTINFNVTAIALSITSTFETNAPYTGAISFPYTPNGAVAKTIHFILDGREIGTSQTSVSGRQMSYTIPAQSHGGHSLKVYFDAEINGELVRSNELYFEFIVVEPLNDTIIITSGFNQTEVEQYTSLQIPFIVYNPNSLTQEVTLYSNGAQVSKQTVDRTEQSYTYRVNEVGAVTFEIVAGSTRKVLQFTVNESDIDVEAETEGLELYLSSQGRSNAEENPGRWVYKTIEAEFNSFNFTSDGWQTDDDGITVCRVGGNARLVIPFQPFARDFRAGGKTIEIEFATRNVRNYDATILSCMSGGRGVSITAQRALLKSEQSEISTQYKEEEHVRISFVVEKRGENRLLLIYINGIVSGAVQYPLNDDFSQQEPVNIIVGNSDCTIDLYCIRVYDNDLNRYQVLDNWIADSQIGAVMLDRYTHNNVYDAYGNVVISQLPNDLPYMILECPELPQYKGDKKTITGSYTDPMYPSKSFTFSGAQADVQGTSSQYYPRKNYKIKFKNGFDTTGGGHSDNYTINAQAVPTNTFTFKADVASSEGANNVELARLYNDACPYKTPAQRSNPKVRQGIDGFPIVMFWSNGEETKFLGKYNFNNDKGTEEVFGFAPPDESWEIKNNTSERVIWKNDNYSDGAWLNDFEGRYPDGYENPEQLQVFATWAKSTDRTQATGDPLPSSVTYEGVTYTNDTADYRLAKFKAEAGNYMEMQSALFYYLFTELFLMVDSRAKNAFPSFIGSGV